MKPIAADTFCEFVSIQKLRLSAQGKLAYLKILPDALENRYRKSISLYDIPAQTGTEDLISLPTLSDLAWLDDTSLLCCSKEPSFDQVSGVAGCMSRFFTLDIFSGRQAEYARIPYDVCSFLPLRGERRCAMTLWMGEESAPASGQQAAQNRGAYPEAAAIPFLQEGHGFLGAERLALCLYSDGVLTRLTSPKESVVAFDVFEGRYIYAIVQDFEEIRDDYSRVVFCDLEHGCLEPVPLQEKLVCSAITAIGPDAFVVTASDTKTHGIYQDHGIYLCDRSTGIRSSFNASGELSLFCSMNSDVYFPTKHEIRPQIANDQCFFIATENAAAHIYSLDLPSGRICRATGCGSPEIAEEFVVFNRCIYYIALVGLDGAELFSADLSGGVCRRLTNYNAAVSSTCRRYLPQPVTFSSPSGEPRYGWILCPPGGREGKKCPGILSVHGGPNTAYGGNYIHELQYLADCGYAVFYCNPRGSVGYGGAFMDIRGAYFQEDVADLIAFTQEVLRRFPWIDEKRIGVMGGSYGGIISAWLAGNSSLFSAVVCERFAADFLSYCGTSGIGFQWMLDTFSVTPWEDIGLYWNYSPLRSVPSVAAPVLLLQAVNDCVCPFSNALEFFSALKYHGKVAKLVAFPGEDHSLKTGGRPQARIKRLQEIKGWFDTYLL